MIEAGTLRFGSFIELNAWLGERLQAIWSDIAKEMRVPRDVLPNLQPSDLIAAASTMRELRARVAATLRVWARRNLGLGNLH